MNKKKYNDFTKNITNIDFIYRISTKGYLKTNLYLNQIKN